MNEPSRQQSSWWSQVVTVLAWLLGVVLPTMTLGIELHTRMCAEEFFDPLPTPVHVLLRCTHEPGRMGLVRALERAAGDGALLACAA